MRLEAKGQYSEAEKIYRAILNKCDNANNKNLDDVQQFISYCHFHEILKFFYFVSLICMFLVLKLNMLSFGFVQLTMKRLITISRAKGDVPTTIKLLNEYLRVYMADTEAWQELAYNYLLVHSYASLHYIFSNSCADEIYNTRNEDLFISIVNLYFVVSI
jgi:tetratricopeptide (TPR) repeat protein